MLKHKAPTVTLLGIAAAITVAVLLSVDSEGRPGTAQASDGNVNVAVGSNFFGTTPSGGWTTGLFELTTIHVATASPGPPGRSRTVLLAVIPTPPGSIAQDF